MRLIFRAGIVMLCLFSFMIKMFTRAKYSDTDSFAHISRVSNYLFALSYASSSVSSVIFDSARQASEGEPISSTIFIISGSFSSAFVSDYQTCNDLQTRDCIISRAQRAEFQKLLLTRQIQALTHILLH